MDFQSIVNAVGSLGFPIAGCIGIFIMYNKMTTMIIEALNNNTQVLTKLVTMMEGNRDEGN